MRRLQREEFDYTIYPTAKYNQLITCKNIEDALAELKEKGIQLIDQVPRKGAGGAKIAFLHPKATSGVLVELCER